MIIINTIKHILALSFGFLIFCSSLLSQTITVATDPVGYVTVDIKGNNKYNFISAPLVNEISYTGRAASISSSTVSISESSWDTDEYVGQYIEFTSAGSGNTGGGHGLFVDIISNSENQLVLADDISSYSLEGDETFVIREYATIASVFGINNSAGLQGGSNAGVADEILLWDPLGQKFDSYFYNSILSRWASSTDPFGTDASNVVLYPDQGIVIFSRSGSQNSLTISGAVKLGKTQGQVFPGFNFYSNIKPVDIKLKDTGWENDLLSGTNGGVADEIGIWNPDSQTLAYYFYNSILSRWAPSTDPFGTDASDILISASDSILIRRKDDGTTLNEVALNN